MVVHLAGRDAELLLDLGLGGVGVPVKAGEVLTVRRLVKSGG
jgi:hypothetical protein